LVGPASAGGVAIFEIADVSTVRAIVDVPDNYAHDVEPGLVAEVYSPRDPSRTVSGTVTRSSGVLAEDTRTLRMEVPVDGGDVVLPGAFVYVRLKVPRASAPPVIPASALIIRPECTMVARIDGDTVTLAKVVLGRDFGKEIEIVEGIAAKDSVVVLPPDTLESGEVVEVVPVTG
jgi:hypothetical protein